MEYSDEVLEATPERSTKLLTGIGAVATIRTLLFEAGMTDDDIAEGRDLLLACLAAPAPKPVKDTDGAAAQRAAVAELDEWDEPNFGRYQAMLRRRHPAVEQYVFKDLKASTGVEAVKGVATFLARLDAIEKHSDPERQDPKTQADDTAAIDRLAKRKLDATERARLAGLVQVALGPTAPLPALTPGQRKAALTALRGWYDEWATTAKTAIKKRGYLIRLGLAARKAPVKKTKAAPAVTTAPAPAPAAPAPGGASPSPK